MKSQRPLFAITDCLTCGYHCMRPFFTDQENRCFKCNGLLKIIAMEKRK
jgi:hypothetical protein